MTRLTVLIIAIFAVVTTAWAGDTTITPGDYILWEEAPVTSEIVFNNDTRQMIFTGEDGQEIVLNDILEKCLEFIKDGDDVIIYSTDYTDTTKSLAEELKSFPEWYGELRDARIQGEISKKREELEKLERETALRREIEKTIKILKGEK